MNVEFLVEPNPKCIPFSNYLETVTFDRCDAPGWTVKMGGLVAENARRVSR